MQLGSEEFEGFTHEQYLWGVFCRRYSFIISIEISGHLFVRQCSV